jgi:hypothetical protein
MIEPTARRFRPTAAWLGAALLLAAACSDATDVSAGLDAPYKYTARDGGGAALVTGELTLAVAEDSIVSGSWSTHWAFGADTTTEVGPQVGHGTLAGRLRHDTLLVDLTPGNADNNAVLLGTWTGDTIVGSWTWITVTGPRTSGPFTATKP